jgi:hypothetical protein
MKKKEEKEEATGVLRYLGEIQQVVYQLHLELHRLAYHPHPVFNVHWQFLTCIALFSWQYMPRMRTCIGGALAGPHRAMPTVYWERLRAGKRVLRSDSDRRSTGVRGVRSS